MEQMKMVLVKQSWSDKSWLFPSFEDAEQWIIGVASRENYGLYRTWEIDGVKHYDCGPRTFTIE